MQRRLANILLTSSTSTSNSTALSQRFSVRQVVFRVSRMMSKPIFAQSASAAFSAAAFCLLSARRSASLAIGGVQRSHRRLVARSSATLPRRASICDRGVLIQLSQRAPHRSQPRRDARRPRPLAPDRRQSSRTSQCYSMRIDVACSVNAVDAIDARGKHTRMRSRSSTRVDHVIARRGVSDEGEG